MYDILSHERRQIVWEERSQLVCGLPGLSISHDVLFVSDLTQFLCFWLEYVFTILRFADLGTDGLQPLLLYEIFCLWLVATLHRAPACDEKNLL